MPAHVLTPQTIPLFQLIYPTRSKTGEDSDIIMRNYLTFREKILLVLYYCIRLAFRLLPARTHAFPPLLQSSEQPHAYVVSFSSELIVSPLKVRLVTASATSGSSERPNG